MVNKSIIITAGGVGKRMGAEIPKQFLELKGQPILMHTINRFYTYEPAIEIILVLPENQIGFWNNMCEVHSFDIEHKIVAGGAERFHSVKNGLAVATGQLIGVHDAVRPLVTEQVIEKCFAQADNCGAAIPVAPIHQSLRKVTENTSIAVDRSQFVLVQTPQCFSAVVLRRAYQLPFSNQFTDDASVVEASGNKIMTVSGNEENIKITTPMDLKIANLLV